MNIPPSLVSQAIIPPPLIKKESNNNINNASPSNEARKSLPPMNKVPLPPPIVYNRSPSNQKLSQSGPVHFPPEVQVRPLKSTPSLNNGVKRNSVHHTKDGVIKPATAGFVQQQQMKGEIPNANKFFHHLHRTLLVDGMKLTQAEAEDILRRAQGTLRCRSEENREQILLDKKGREFLRNITNQIKTFVTEQNDLRNIIRVQSVARRFLVLKKFRGLGKSDIEQLKRRNEIYFGIIRTEEQYVKTIDRLIDTFVLPLRHSDFIAPYECASIFSNLESISEVHKDFLKKLRFLEKNFPFVKGIGKVFLDLTAILKAYSVYVSNFKNAINEVERMQSENQKFENFLIEKSSDWADLSTLLSMPLNRLAQYAHLLQSLSENLNEGTEDYLDCIKSISVLTQSSSVIETNLAISNDTAPVQACQRRLRADGPINLIVPGRILHHELKTKKYSIFLFSDILIAAKPLSKKKDPQHRMGMTKSKEELLKITLSCDIQIVDMVETDQKNIEIKNNSGGKVIKIPFASADKKMEWLKLFRTTLEEKNRSKIFGVSLVDTTSREDRAIPTIIEKVIQYIIQTHIAYAGIFRVAGSKVEIDKLKSIFDSGGEEVKSLDFGTYNIFSVCDVLKLYLRSLPEPLLGYHLYKPIVDLMKNDSIEDKYNSIKDIILSVPSHVLNVISYLMQFLRQVATHSDVNKMSASNLSIVFGPTLLWSEANTLECALDIPYINSFIHSVIERGSDYC